MTPALGAAPPANISMTIRAHALLLSCAVCISACSSVLFDDSCGSEYRTTRVQAELRGVAGARIGVAFLSLSETRGDSITRDVQLVVMGPAYGDPGPLSGKVTKVRMLAEGVVVREFAFQPGNEHEVVRIAPEAMTQAQFDDLRRLAIAGSLVLELETTLEGNTKILTPLPLQYAGDWDRAHCS